MDETLQTISFFEITTLGGLKEDPRRGDVGPTTLGP